MSTKKKKAAAEKPSLISLVATAGEHYGKSLQHLVKFAETYVLAVSLYGNEAKVEFRNKYPLYYNSMWSHLEAVGKHQLLPHFLLASDTCIAGILRLSNSMEAQLKMVGAMKDGKIETISNSGKITLHSLDELSKLDELGIVFAMSRATSPAEIRKFMYEYRAEWKKMNPRKDDYEVKGDFLVINHAMKRVSKSDWLAMGRMMGWST